MDVLPTAQKSDASSTLGLEGDRTSAPHANPERPHRRNPVSSAILNVYKQYVIYDDKIAERLAVNVDTRKVIPPVLVYTFLSGFVNTMTFTACFVFCGFQTGNTVQLALSLARMVSGPDRGTELLIGPQQALISLLGFLAGAFISRMVGNHSANRPYGPKSRGWLMAATLLSACFTIQGAICSKISGESGEASRIKGPSWTGGHGLSALAFLSLSMGVQGAIATPIGAHLANTLAVTALWLNLVTVKGFLKLKFVRWRDERILALLAFFFGAFCGRAMANEIGPSWTIAAAALIRVALAGWWIVAPAAPARTKINFYS
ncbi:hypothetical protein DL93DRAFT_2054468 [Clavulina sp. PMI_390]|nr:hypothetical protein DL93DRAFT_2054468 [Clavulina sp. PMI_390]